MRYLGGSIGDHVNQIGSFLQQIISNAYLSGFVDGMESVTGGGNHTIAPMVTKYQHTVIEDDVYERGDDGFFYKLNDTSDLPKHKRAETNFIIPEYKPTSAINSRTESFDIGTTVRYDDDNYTLHNFLVQPDDTILVSIGPSIQEHLSGDSKRMKVVDINDIQPCPSLHTV